MLLSAAERAAENLRRRTYEYETGRTTLRSLPDVFAIESTNFCNIRCVMCPRGEPDLMERPLGHMDDAVFRKIVDGWEFFTEPCWFHWFGEPLMHPRLFEQIAYAKAAGVRNLGISSNATLLTEARSSQLLDSELDTLMLCIDGTNAATYEHIRRSAAFTYDEVCANVRRFLSLRGRAGRPKPHTILQIIVMEETRDQVAEFEAIWRAAGADEILFKQYTAWGNQSEHDFTALAPLEQRSRLAAATRAHACYNMWSSVVIAWDGTVVPCCYDYDTVMPMGNVREQSLAEIWNGEAYRALREAERSGNNMSPLCRNCTEAPGYVTDPSAAPPPGYPD
jgi:radical SAM protein with 4Fe4S-binding SPASM domain